ncbi:hypothetical protein PVBG_05610 [Plasmodium vivax Brazil I]|uniref:Variable surface protein Vir18 n=1 Tax=Plasmodium vivax (strain Brazil I) TaxID=1033975 RepID=A0A0J9T135_PLAV1|nr:hypothetical protein PVBG_05610 [Plasmodium vivax Brazil I]
MGSITINIYDKDQTLDSQECLERYFEILENIQGSIAEFERKEYADFNKDWEELIKYINEQKKKLKICYDRNLLEIHLNSDADISGFYRKCNANPKCLNYISPQDKKLTELKDDTETSCEGRNCGKKVKAAKGKTGVKTPQLNEKGSVMKTLETQKSQGQGENHVDGKEPRQEQVISQDHPHVISLRPSVEPKSDGSEPKLDHHSNPHIPIDNPTQRLGIAPQPTHRALDSNPSDSSLQNSSEGDSPSIGTSQGKTPETVASQRDTRNSQTLNDNAHGKQAVGSQTYEEHTSVDKDAVVASATENRDVGTSISGNPGHRNPPPIVTDGAVDGSISLPSVGATGIRGTTELSGHAIYSVECTTGSALPGEVDTTKAAGNSPTDSKAADEVLGVEAKQDKVPCSENPCNNDSHQVFSVGTSCSEALSNCQKIQGNRDSSASVSNSAELQMDNSTQSKPHTEQEASDQGNELQKEKTRTDRESNQEVHSGKEHRSNMQQSQTQGGHEGSTEGLHHVNHETSEGGKQYLQDKHPQPTTCVPTSTINDGETLVSSQSNRSGAGATGEAVTTGSGNVLDIFNRLFSNVPYKEYIMMALVPLAIILLLTFLIKFTPLGTFFTKKKKKEQKKMNEKLQRVLSEYPAQMNERNIPFSYSPFAYSTQ